VATELLSNTTAFKPDALSFRQLALDMTRLYFPSIVLLVTMLRMQYILALLYKLVLTFYSTMAREINFGMVGNWHSYTCIKYVLGLYVC